MQLISKFDRGFTITNAFHKSLIWAGKSSEFHNRSMKSFFQNNGIEIYSTQNEGKSVIPDNIIIA